MFDSFIKLVIGDLGDKRAYKEFKKRVEALPEDYQYAFEKIQRYMYTVGPLAGDFAAFTDLLELFESGVAEGRPVLEIIGSDVGKFSDEFMEAYIPYTETEKEKLNREILARFNKEGE